MSRTSYFGFVSMSLLLLGALAGCQGSANDDQPQRQFGPPGGGGRGSFNLLNNEKVQKELALTDKQKESIKKLSDDFRTAMSDLSDGDDRFTKIQALRKTLEDKIAALLDAKQTARMKEIELQVQGPAGLTSKETADALKLTDDQVEQIKKLAETVQTDIRDTFQAMQAGAQVSFNDVQDEVTRLRKESDDKILAVLTADQKVAFEKMQGAKFELPGGGFGGGFGGRFGGGFGGPGGGGPPGGGGRPAGGGGPGGRKAN